MLSRWFSSQYHGGVHDEKSVARHTVNLLTSTIKVDADQSDLRFCFRIISPTKNYTLQVESWGTINYLGGFILSNVVAWYHLNGFEFQFLVDYGCGF